MGAGEEPGQSIDTDCGLKLRDAADVFRGLFRDDARHISEDGSGEEHKADEVVFVMVWSFKDVNTKEEGMASNSKDDEDSQSTPDLAKVTGPEHGINVVYGAQRGDQEADGT